MKIKTLNEITAVNTYLQRIGADARSLKTAVVRESHGVYWRDIATINFEKDGENNWKVKCPEGYAPTPSELALIEKEMAAVIWPKLQPLARIHELPEELQLVDPATIFEFRSWPAGEVIMLQQRIDPKAGDKAYVPWTYWDDGEWRRMEPEGKLPIWGMDQLNDYTTVFIHEGAKAARYVRWMVEGKTEDAKKALREHPWGDELQAAAHLGWIGGALSPSRTNWDILKKAGVQRAYIVSDNDEQGLAAVAPIAQRLRMPTFHIQFTQEWRASFDLADPFPKTMFQEIEGKRYYIGPTFQSCTHPATWATDQIPNEKGKPSIVLRENFKNMWSYIEEADLFVCIEMPEILRTEPVMNKMLAGFSHSSNTSALMVKSYRGRQTRLCYRPDVKGRIVTDKTTSAINLHTPTQVKSAKGNAQPFLDFLEYMLPIEVERKEVQRWVATLIARPEVRMEYGLLLVSEAQGIGKTTLSSSILAPLVGIQNTGFPTETDIVESAFNGWLANKRLIVISEIYSGHSWKAYNKLKTYITDKDIEVNQKYMRPYRVENWAHVFASSNSKRALRMEEDDRRWFYPEVTETRWSRAKFAELNAWINSGGLGIIKAWAEAYGEYVSPGERAPMTERKKELIEGSRSEAQREVASLAEAIVETKEMIAMSMKDIEGWVRASAQGKVFDSDYELRKTMKEAGVIVYDKRMKIGGRAQYVILSPTLFERIRTEDDATAGKIVRDNLKKPTDILEGSM